MDFFFFLFYACLGLASVSGCGPRRLVLTVSRLLCSNVRGLEENLSDLTVASSR